MQLRLAKKTNAPLILNPSKVTDKKRIGNFNNQTIQLESDYTIIPRTHNFFREDIRRFPVHTIAKEPINKTPLNQRLPHHDIDSNGLKIYNKELDAMKFLNIPEKPTKRRLPFEDMDDMNEEMPLVHRLIVNPKVRF